MSKMTTHEEFKAHNRKLAPKPEVKPAIQVVDIADVKLRYMNMRPDGHWFDADTLNFFQSRIARTGLKQTSTGTMFFISSEQQPGYARLYTIRAIDTDGRISNVGEFQEFSSSRAARRGLKQYLTK